MNEYTYNLTLRVSHPSVSPLEMIKHLNFDPMVYWNVGENKITNINKGKFSRPIINKESYCCFEVERPGNKTILESLKMFLDKVSPARDFMDKVVGTGGKVTLSIGWYVNNNAGEEIDWEILKELSLLKVGLLFDVYSN